MVLSFEQSGFSPELPGYALAALDALEARGWEAWLVGGCVRDALLGRDVNDYDIASSAPWQEAERALAEAGFTVHRTGTAHGTVTASLGGEAIEVTTFRTEGAYSDGRHPDAVTFVGDIEQDLARRDFTVNALAYHPARGICDCWGGIDDLRTGTLRAVGEAPRRFREDGLRILRGCRFASQLGFSIEEQTLFAMKANKRMLGRVSVERIAGELDALLLGDHVHDALMTCADVLCAVLPEIAACRGFDQCTPYHIYDVWEHTAWVVQRAPASRLGRWAALLHDIGKPAAFFRDGQRGHFYGHADISVVLGRSIMERLKMAPAFSKRVLALVRIHDEQIPATERDVRRALGRLGGDVELFETLIGLKRADALAQSELGEGRVRLAGQLEEVLRDVLERDLAYSLRQLAIDGNDVRAIGVPGGPAVGEALGAALDAVVDGRVANEHEALVAFVGAWSENADD